MHLTVMRFDPMTSGNKCKVKDHLVNQLITLNDKLNSLSPALLHSEQARAEVQERRESLYLRSSTIGRRDTKADLALPPNAYPTVRVSSKFVPLPIWTNALRKRTDTSRLIGFAP